jgi:penicillin-binding protein 2D
VDAWFVGYTPRLVTGVWIGFDQPKTIIAGGYAGEVAVPLWGRFMKAATKGDRPEWFTPPKGLVGVAICRLSGKLPAQGCSDVEVINDAGEVTHRSMVITDYFPRGQVPTEVCPLHQGDGNVFQRMAGWFGKEGPKPASETDLGLPTQSSPGVKPVEVGGDQVRPAIDERRDEERKEKKHGFWSRVFGRGKDDKKPK